MTGKTQYETPHMMTGSEGIRGGGGGDGVMFAGGLMMLLIIYYLEISCLKVKEKEKGKEKIKTKSSLLHVIANARAYNNIAEFANA